MTKAEKLDCLMHFSAVLEFYRDKLKALNVEEAGAREYMRSENITDPTERLKLALEEKDKCTMVYYQLTQDMTDIDSRK